MNANIPNFIQITLSLYFLLQSAIGVAANYEYKSPEMDIFTQPDILSPIDDKTDGFLPIYDEPSINFKEQHDRVMLLLKQGNFEEAQKQISQLLKQFPNEAEFRNLQGFLDTLQKNPEAAEKSFQQAVGLDSRNVVAMLGLAKLSLEAQQLDQAKDYAQKALALNSKVYTADLVLASVALMRNNPSEAEAVLLEAKKKNKGNFQAEIEIVGALGRVYALQQQQPKIEQVIEELNRHYPNRKEALSLLVAAQIANQKKAEAEQTLARIIKLDAKDIDHRLMLARLWMEQAGKEKEIINLSDEAIAADPKKPHGWFTKAAYYIKLKQFSKASDLIDNIDKQFPNLAATQQFRGDLYLSNNQIEQALTSYQQAYRMQPNGLLLNSIINILIGQGKINDAVKFIEDQLAQRPNDGQLHFKLATIFQHLKEAQKAEQHYQAILKIDPDNIWVLNNLAWLYLDQNDMQKSIKFAKRAYEKSPESPAIIDTYGYMLKKQGQLKEGLILLEKAAKLAPESYDIQYHLAEAHVADGNIQQAQLLLEKIISADQPFNNKTAAVHLLEKIKQK